VGVQLPEADEAVALLARLGVPADDLALVLADRPSDQRSHDVVLSRARILIENMGTWHELPAWPARADFLYVWAFLAALPAVREYHATRGVPDDVSWASLADLGRAIEETRWRTGKPGFGHVWWLMLHFRGGLYRLGRLQFSLERDALGVHIPRDGGRLTPEACDSSFARAAEFFPERFPTAGTDVMRCTSWLLDPQLADYLGDDSNIVRFGRRFALTDELRPGDDNIIHFVFGAPKQPIAALPQTTALKRAIVRHLSAGKHWHVRRGYLPLDDAVAGDNASAAATTSRR
jgi:hypothetical protein